MVSSIGPENDQLKAWEMFYCSCLSVVVGGEAAGAGVLAGKNGCSVSIY